MSQKSREARKKRAAGGLQPGDLIPMLDHQREFLKVHGKFVYNPEMELIMAADPKTNKKDMRFGNSPLPWELPVTAQDLIHLQQARQRTFKCKNKHCDMFEKETSVIYKTVIHKKEIPHSNTGNKEIDAIHNDMALRRFGKREQVCMHIEVCCSKCRQHIQYVKRTMSNRRAAEDPYVSGPHQNRY